MRGEWIRELSLGFTNHVGTRRVLDVYLHLGCDGVGGVCGEWVVDLPKTTVTAPPLVGCVVWRPIEYITPLFNLSVTTCQIPGIYNNIYI